MNRSLLNQRYVLLRKLAAGGMGEIYLARQTGTEGFQREVVLKRIHRRLSDHPKAVRMFLDEARLAAGLSHPNVVQIYDICQEDQTYFIVMERIRGTSLRELAETTTRQGKMIPLEQSINIMIQVLEGLRYAHRFRDESGRELKIVHRDICPTNILISYDGAVKLVDFGIARAEGQLLQESGLPSGKFAYMSPEMLRGEAVDARTDLLSVGVLLYELTVGQRLFRATSLEAMKRILDDPIPPPTFSRAGYPVDLEIIVMRALERAPEDRFTSADAMLEELERFAFSTGLRISRLRLGRFVSQAMGVQSRDEFPVEAPEGEAEAGGEAVQEDLDFDHGLFEAEEAPPSRPNGPPPEAAGASRTSSVVEAIQQANEAIAELVSAAEADDEEEGRTLEIRPSKQARLRADTVPPADPAPRDGSALVVTEDMIELEESSQPGVDGDDEEEIDFDMDLQELEPDEEAPPEPSADLMSALADISQEIKAGEASDRQRGAALERMIQRVDPTPVPQAQPAERPSALVDTLLGKRPQQPSAPEQPVEPQRQGESGVSMLGDELELVDHPEERPLDDLELSDVEEGDSIIIEPAEPAEPEEQEADDDDHLDDSTIELDPASEPAIEEVKRLEDLQALKELEEALDDLDDLDDLDGPTIQDLPRVAETARRQPEPEEAVTVPMKITPRALAALRLDDDAPGRSARSSRRARRRTAKKPPRKTQRKPRKGRPTTKRRGR